MDEFDFTSDLENEIFESIKSNDVIIDNEKSSLNDYCIIIEIQRNAKQIQMTLKKLYVQKSDNIDLCLEGKWTDTNFEVNDIVFINCSKYDCNDNKYQLNDQDNLILTKNFIVLEPEIILGSTLIKYGFPCQRRAIINELFKTVNKQNKISKEIIIGVIVHKIFEFIVIKGDNNMNNVNSYIEETIRKHHLELALLKYSIDECKQTIKEFVYQILNFFKQFIVSSYI